MDNTGEQRSILDDHPEWLAEFEAAARRLPATRLKYAFVRTYKPVLDDARYRSFESMAEYRRWCEENLPPWLGYGRVYPADEGDQLKATGVLRAGSKYLTESIDG